jgi:uracil-DNA glycosylase
LNSPLINIVERIRAEQGLSKEVPTFDPKNGNENARFLFVMEAPGAKAVESGYLSFENNDLTAKNFQNQLSTAGIARKDIAIWNAVPWYIGNTEQTRIRAANGMDVKQGLKYLVEIVAAINNLQCIVLVGGAARQAHIHLSQHTSSRILSCHHPSPRVMNLSPEKAEENIAVFRHMLETSKS